jgi:ferric-dicitrate binding protein FerR (iron transport regulator)
MEFKLIIKKLNNTLNLEDEIIFSKWYNKSVNHKNYFDNVKENYSKDITNIDVAKGWEELTKKINYIPKKTASWKYAAAAAVIFLVTMPFVFNKDNVKTVEPIIVKNTIKIGIDKATLTLEDGSNITLEKGQNYHVANAKSNGKTLIYNTKSKSNLEIAYNYLTTPRGGQFYVELSDGTKVWLNSESKLKYPVVFQDGVSRKVELLYGEAYFDVSASTNHKGASFKVASQVQEIEVLGTEFNVKAYKGEDHIYTTLVEGKVAIDNGVTKEILKPKQQAAINIQNKEITIAVVDVYNATSWKDGVFSFKELSLKEIMKTLSRWYDTDVIFINKELENIKFNGVLNKKQNIEHILLIIKATNNIDYEINDNKIMIK